MITFDCKLDRGPFSLDATFDGARGITALFGRSGSGKSTIIRLIAGLERPQRGRIRLGDHVLLDTDRKLDVKPHKRGIGMVFQDAQLFPHLNVRNNLLYGRYFSRTSPGSIGFDAVVDVLGISHLLGRQPQTLSGGERQRVAIGRAMLKSPRLLLMDEPLAALDQERKREILPFIERLRDEFAVPIVYVSHAVEEVARLASKVVKVHEGSVVAVGAPDVILSPGLVERPRDRFDVVSSLTTTVDRYDENFGVTHLRHAAGSIVVPGQIGATDAARVIVRATNVALARDAGPRQFSIRNALRGRVSGIEENQGPFALVIVDLDGGDRLLSYITRLALADMELQTGQEVFALLKAVSINETGIMDASHAAEHVC